MLKMMKVDNKVEPISTIDTRSKTDYLEQLKEFASIPESQIKQKNETSQPKAYQLNEAFEDARLSTQQAFAQESQIHQENGISSFHYFSWLSDIFLSIASTGIWTIIPQHNMLEEPSYW